MAVFGAGPASQRLRHEGSVHPSLPSSPTSSPRLCHSQGGHDAVPRLRQEPSGQGRADSDGQELPTEHAGAVCCVRACHCSSNDLLGRGGDAFDSSLQLLVCAGQDRLSHRLSKSQNIWVFNERHIWCLSRRSNCLFYV